MPKRPSQLRTTSIAAAMAVTMIGFGSGAHGAELVPGGQALLNPPSVSVANANRGGGVSLDEFSLSSNADSGMTVIFTPRAAAYSESNITTPRAAGTLADSGRLAALGVGGESMTPGSRGSTGSMSIGGALAFEDWTVSGGLARTELFGNQVDMVGAGVGYGRVTASLAIGQVPLPQQGQSPLLLFSTDLAASSWLSLQGDLAVTQSYRDDSLASGRIGLKLRF